MIELSKSSGLHLIDLNSWFDTLVVAFLGLGIGTAQSLDDLLAVIQFNYFL